MREINEQEINESNERKGFWTYGRIMLMALGFVLVIVAVSTSRRTQNPTTAGRPATAPPPKGAMDTAIKSIDGEVFRLSDYKGKIVVLDLWATWCGPCRMEIPHLVQISEEYAGRGVEVIGLSVEDPVADEMDVRNFAREYKINYKLGWAEDEWFMTMTRGNGSIPQTFVFDREGAILLHAPGYSSRLPQMIRQAIEKAGA